MGTNKKCRCGFWRNRGLTVDAVIFRQGKILLIKRNGEPEKGFFALPGGFVDWDETVEAACRREVREETGLEVTALKLIGVFSDPKRIEQRITVAYRCETEGEPVSGDDAAAVAWFAIEALPAKLAFDHDNIIAAAARKLD